MMKKIILIILGIVILVVVVFFTYRNYNSKQDNASQTDNQTVTNEGEQLSNPPETPDNLDVDEGL